MVYHALAEALAGPVPGIQSMMVDVVTTGARQLDSAACRKAAVVLAELPTQGVATLRASYSRLTNSRGGRPLALYESLCRHGRLAGPATWQVRNRYRAVGLDTAGGELPDHASMELAFLGRLADAEAEAQAASDGQLVARLRAEQRRFLEEHAGNWIPEVGAVLAAGDDPFYATVGRLLTEFLSEELTGRTREGHTGNQLPVLREPATCTLCGLCVGSCPLGALRVVESATETALTLDTSRCIGCDRCLRTCPEEVLVLLPCAAAGIQSGATNRTGHHVLRRSRRATCPRCGRPTVSQAELNAVVARLQPDTATLQQLSLCVECKSRNTKSFC